jgi:hypothetical protein
MRHSHFLQRADHTSAKNSSRVGVILLNFLQTVRGATLRGSDVPPHGITSVVMPQNARLELRRAKSTISGR